MKVETTKILIQPKVKLRKNLRVKNISQNLFDARYIANFLGISLNALYLRMHFENFPQAVKLNGKLYFDINKVLEFMKEEKESNAYCFLVRDEIRSLIDFGQIDRIAIGELLGSKNPAVAGGAVYLRNIGYERAEQLEKKMAELGIKFEFSHDKSYFEQKMARVAYITVIWEVIIKLVEEKRLQFGQIGAFICTKNQKNIGRAVCNISPSYKVAKVVELMLLKHGYLTSAI